MKRFILSDLHIGHPDAQYDVLKEVVAYVEENYEAGDKIWGLGDWFHIDDGIGFETCLANPIASKFGELAATVPIELVPGNHDKKMEEYQNGYSPPKPIDHIKVIKPFIYNSVWYCHGHEFDPATLPCSIWNVLTSWLPRRKRITPGAAKEPGITKQYLALVQPVQMLALLAARDREGCNGVVFGHTHLPIYQESPVPEVPFLLNDGDMRGSATFVVYSNDHYQFVTWDPGQKHWQIMLIPKPVSG